MAHVEELVATIRREAFDEIEFLRDEVTEDLLGELEKAYWELETWYQRAGMVQLVGDYLEPALHSMMLDILGAPDDLPGANLLLVTKATAICVLQGSYDDIGRFSSDQIATKTRSTQLRDRAGVPSAPPRPRSITSSRES